MQSYYTIYAKNLYAVASVLIHNRVPFVFIPHKRYNDRRLKNEYNKSVMRISIDKEHYSFADILYLINERYGETFGVEIIEEEDEE